MIDDATLRSMSRDIESDRVERKQSFSDYDKVGQAICAFANDLPGHAAAGVVLVGVRDSGAPLGITVTDELLRDLSSYRTDGNVLPPPSLTVQKRMLDGSEVAVVEVLPSDAPPVRFRGQVWIRVGPRRAVATAEEERRLGERTTSRAKSFDQRPVPDSTLDDLLADEFTSAHLPRAVSAQSLAENKRSVEERLASLRLFDLKRGVPTNAGILVVGRDPLVHLPGAYVQFTRYTGASLADNVSSAKTITGNIPTQLRQLDELLPLHLTEPRALESGLRHATVPDYPLAAIREVVLNAVCHRSYEATNAPVRVNWFSDRVEVQSPGGLYGQVTSTNYHRVTDYRNPVLAEWLKILGYVDRFGVGVARVSASMAANGNPSPQFTFEPTHVNVVLPRRST